MRKYVVGGFRVCPLLPRVECECACQLVSMAMRKYVVGGFRVCPLLPRVVG